MNERHTSLDESRRQIESACRSIAQAWQSATAAGRGCQQEDYEGLIKDAAKSASELKTPTQAYAFYRYYTQTPPPMEDDAETSVAVKNLILDALADIITKTDAHTISDIHARIDFIEQLARNGKISNCAKSLRRDLYELSRRLTL